MICPQCENGELKRMTWQQAYPAPSGELCDNYDCQATYLDWGQFGSTPRLKSANFESAKEFRERTRNV